MKNTLISIFLVAAAPLTSAKKDVPPINREQVSGNIFIITTDGLRWQEVFTGADSILINNDEHTPDNPTVKALYWASGMEERRKLLMPFMWNVVVDKGQLYGNRLFENRVNVSNLYAKSYPGYNEIFTGHADPAISSNGKYTNPNSNVLEYLDTKPGFKGKVAAFTSWDIFPYIFNKKNNSFFLNSGYEKVTGPSLTREQLLVNTIQENEMGDKTATRYDGLTFIHAKEYIRNNRPRVLFLGLGETDEFAHQGRYDLYLEQANKVDKMIAELWHWVQTTAGYRDNTTFIITTDHGRGSRSSKWGSHGRFIKGSSQIWVAVMGPGIKPVGEVKEDQQLFQEQFAQTMANLLGEEFTGKNIAPAIVLK